MKLKTVALGAGALGLAAALLLPMTIRATNARASNKAATLDLTGAWQLDPSKSDRPQRGMGGGGMRGGGMGGGMRGGGGMGGGMGRGMGGGRHTRGGPPGEGVGEGTAQGDRPAGDRGMRLGLPRFLRIATTDTGLALEDSSGAVMREIALVPLPANETSVEHRAPRTPGAWKGDKLEVEREDSRGGKITETFSLEDKGATLVVKTKMTRSQGGDFEIKRVYHKVGA
jgi:hypothetical protein